jgi:hypothetical protein
LPGPAISGRFSCGRSRDCASRPLLRVGFAQDPHHAAGTWAKKGNEFRRELALIEGAYDA